MMMMMMMMMMIPGTNTYGTNIGILGVCQDDDDDNDEDDDNTWSRPTSGRPLTSS